MPVYFKDQIEEVKDLYLPTMQKTVVGELMKVGFVKYAVGETPPPHDHPNEEQFIVVLKGRLAVFIDEKETVIYPGDIVHIPRGTLHGIHVVEEEVEFFVCKSPTGGGQLSSDYRASERASEVRRKLQDFEVQD